MPRPTIVLLPGMDGTSLLFAPLVKALPSSVDARVVAFPHDRALDYAALAALVVDALPRDRGFVIVGESFSGPLALMIAATAPQGLRGVVLSTSFATCPIPFATLVRPFVRPTMFRISPRALETTMMLGPFATPELRELLARALALPTPEVIAARARAILSVDATRALRAIGLPVLALRATRDRLVPASNAARLLATRPGTRLVDLDGPHLLLQARPHEAWRTIAAFMLACGLEAG